MIVRQKSRPAGTHPPERPRGVPAAPLPPGHARAAEVLRELRMTDPRGQEQRQQPKPPQVRTDPTPELRASTAIELAIYMETNYVLDDTVAALAQFANLLRPMIETGWPIDHVTRMVLMPVAARVADLLDAEMSGPVECSTWDHRPIGVAVGRELGTKAATR